MKKFLMILVAIIGLGISASAQSSYQGNQVTNRNGERVERTKQESKSGNERPAIAPRSENKTSSSSTSTETQKETPRPSQENSQQRPAQGNLQGNPVR